MMDAKYADLWHYRNVQRMCVEIKRQGLGGQKCNATKASMVQYIKRIASTHPAEYKAATEATLRSAQRKD